MSDDGGPPPPPPPPPSPPPWAACAPTLPPRRFIPFSGNGDEADDWPRRVGGLSPIKPAPTTVPPPSFLPAAAAALSPVAVAVAVAVAVVIPADADATRPFPRSPSRRRRTPPPPPIASRNVAARRAPPPPREEEVTEQKREPFSSARGVVPPFACTCVDAKGGRIVIVIVRRGW